MFYSLKLPYSSAYHNKAEKSSQRKLFRPEGHSPEFENGFLEWKTTFLLEQSILKFTQGEAVAFSMALSKEPMT